MGEREREITCACEKGLDDGEWLKGLMWGSYLSKNLDVLFCEFTRNIMNE